MSPTSLRSVPPPFGTIEDRLSVFECSMQASVRALRDSLLSEFWRRTGVLSQSKVHACDSAWMCGRRHRINDKHRGKRCGRHSSGLSSVGRVK
jgi:hypothetical protein